MASLTGLDGNNSNAPSALSSSSASSGGAGAARGAGDGSGARAVARSSGAENDDDVGMIRGGGEKIEVDEELILKLEKIQRRSEFMPLRLDAKERILLGVLEGALDVSEYTDKCDVSTNDIYMRERHDKNEIVMKELKIFFTYLCGLSAANDPKMGKKLLASERDILENGEFITNCLEVGRRHKRMNPDKMRSTYGKLVYLMMDAISPQIRRSLNFNVGVRVTTVRDIVRSRIPNKAKEFFLDPDLVLASREITESSIENRKRASEEKSRAIQRLVQKYADVENHFPESEVCRVISSIEDDLSFLRSNKGPVSRMLYYLKRFFDPNTRPANSKYSLDISYGQNGSKISHTHKQQFYFAKQSLLLWAEIMEQFHRLWGLSEDDLLGGRNGYHLVNTGQGLQRCQNAPNVASAMGEILAKVKSKLKENWEGISVVHLGDRDVPNALIFIDKYTQVPRILSPLVAVLDALETRMKNDPGIYAYIIDNFKTMDDCYMTILSDYFKHGFDGSGDDGGSCIDGRLTSTWNWCSNLTKKPYYGIFLFSGFQGFDGNFQV